MTARTRWSPSALQTLDGCMRRFALREAGWQPKPDPMRASSSLRGTAAPPAPHAQFGRIWHACAETFDRAMWGGDTREQATEQTMDYALDATWEVDRPWAGDVAAEWRCRDGKVPSDKTGKPVNCPGTKGWWLDEYHPPHDVHACTKCGGPVNKRVAMIPHHKVKNRVTLLRAVLDYCDDALPGVATVDFYPGRPYPDPVRLPGLEIDLPFRLDGVELHAILDRYTQIGSTYLAHERKTSSRWPFWDGYAQTYQVRFYPEALRQNGLRCDGVLIEHYQIQAGGTHRSTTTISPGPDQVAEAVTNAIGLIHAAQKWEGRDPLDRPPRFSHCAHAAGGLPCEYLKVCLKADSRRHETLIAEFEQKERA